MEGVTLDMTKDIAANLTVVVNVVGQKKWRVRLWIATQLFKLAAKTLNAGIRFE